MSRPAIDVNRILRSKIKQLDKLLGDLKDLQVLDACDHADSDLVRSLRRIANETEEVVSWIEDIYDNREITPKPGRRWYWNK